MSAKRRPRRFFSVCPLPPPDQTFVLPAAEARHLLKVIRLKTGDTCLVTDGKGREVTARLETQTPEGGLLLRVEEERLRPGVSALEIHVYAALAKGDKFDFLVQKAQELGVRVMHPLYTERTLVRLEGKKESAKLERWHKIAAEAAKQSGNLDLLEVRPVLALKQAPLALPRGAAVAVFHPDPEACSFRGWLESRVRKEVPEGQHLFFGPEGGFAPAEIKKLREEARLNGLDFSLVSLGSSILRVETAVVGVLAALHLMTQNAEGSRE